MGRPISKKFFGALTKAGEQIQATAWTTATSGASTCFIVKQKSTSRYLVSTTATSVTGICKLVNGPSAVTEVGLMSVAVLSSAVAAAVMEENGAITVASGGTGYTVGDVITVVGGTGTKATHTVASITPGTGAVLTVSAPGAGATTRGLYTVLPATTGAATTTVGSGVGLTVNIPTFRVNSVAVISGGIAYTVAPSVTITGGGGSGFTVGTATIANGSVTTIPVTGNGTGYTSIPTISVTGSVEYARKITRHKVVTFSGNVYQWVVEGNALAIGKRSIETS